MSRSRVLPVAAVVLTLLLLSSGPSGAATTESANQPAQQSEPYPTLDRVEFVVGCMNIRGGQNYTNMYGCVCMIDKIAEAVPYKLYIDAITLGVMMKTPGERGGAFRDAPGARKLTKGYDEVVAEAERKCFIN